MTPLSFALKAMEKDHLVTLPPTILSVIMLHSLWMNFFSLSVVHVIQNQMLSHLPPSAKDIVSSLFNRIREGH
jgi:hypothetical protein